MNEVPSALSLQLERVSGILLMHGAGPASAKKELEQFWLAGKWLWLPRPELGLVGTFPGHPPWGIRRRPSPGLPQWRREEGDRAREIFAPWSHFLEHRVAFRMLLTSMQYLCYCLLIILFVF